MLPGRPRRLPLIVAIAALAVAAGSQLPTALAASAPKADRTVTLPAQPGKNVVTFKGHAPFNSGQANLLFDDATGACDGTTTALRDTHTVRVRVPEQPASKYDVLIRFSISWTNVLEPLADIRLDLFGPDGKLVSSSDSSQFQEGINLTAAKPGVYSMHTCSFQSGPTGQDFTGKVTAETLVPKAYPRATGVKAPRYYEFIAPKGISDDAGEPSIGNSWKTGHTFFTSYTHEYDVAFHDKANTSKWTGVNLPPNAANVESFDPIGFTDSKLGRTFVSQLFFVCSGMVYTDDDFASTSNPSEGCGSGINGADHQTVGGGPFPKGMSPLGGYKHAVYYCSQAIGLVLGNATCARSDDGGATFGATHNVYNGRCNGLHGHIRVAPDGTAYLPNSKCGSKQGMAVSTNGGRSWTIRKVPGSVAGESDPSVAAGKDGTVYFGFSDGTGRPKIAVSGDRGKTWLRVANIGTGVNVHNSEFAEVIAGDGKRASFAFLGTHTRGSTQADSFGKNASLTKFVNGNWHLYIATTYDRGRTWTTVDSTPVDPIQRGCVWNGGGSNSCRNLLDFNDITVDKFGRVMVGLADGCVPHAVESDDAVTGNPTNNCSNSALVAKNGLVQHGAIVRQQSGKGLFAQYDGRMPRSGYALPHSVSAGTGTDTGNTSGSGGNDSEGAPAVSNSGMPATGGTPFIAGLATLLAGGALALRYLRRREHALA